MKGLRELLSCVSKKTLIGIRCLTINTRANMVVIVSSVITRIFLTLCNVGQSYFNLFDKDTHDLFMLWIMLICQLYHVLLLLLFDLLLLLLDYSFIFCLSFVWLLFHSIIVLDSVFMVHYSLENIQFWCWIVFQIFWSRCIWYHYHLCKSINILHQTAPSLS